MPANLPKGVEGLGPLAVVVFLLYWMTAEGGEARVESAYVCGNATDCRFA